MKSPCGSAVAPCLIALWGRVFRDIMKKHHFVISKHGKGLKIVKVRFWVLILALCLLPVSALAVIEPSDGVDKNGSIITLSGNYEEYTISGSETDVSIVIESGVKSLVLRGASITAPEGRDALTANGSLQLHTFGSNTITGGSSYTDSGRGIVLPADGLLTINGIGSLEVNGGDTLYEDDENAIEGMGGTAIIGSVTLQGDVHVVVEGGNCQSGYHEEEVTAGNGVEGDVIINAGRLTATGGSALGAYSDNYSGHGITGNVTVNAGRLTAAGGQSTGGRSVNKGGCGVYGSAMVNDGQLTATGGSAFEHSSTFSIINSGGHGVYGNAEVNGGQLTATGGWASGGEFSNNIVSKNEGGHGVNGSAVINGGQLIATGSSASLSTIKNTGGNGVNGAFTAAGGYALAAGGVGDDAWMGKAASATDAAAVTIGGSGTFLSASVGEGTSPDTLLNDGEFYTAAVNETDHVSGKRSLETKEHFAVVYVCAYDGCEDSYTDYAEGNKTYTVKTPEALGFENHGLAFAGFADENGNAVDSLTVSGPMILKGSWKVVFTFDAGEGGANPAPPVDAITSGSTIRLPECGMAAPAGQRFAGWKLEGDDQIYAAGDEVPAAREIRLTAVWERIPVPPATGDCAMPILWLLLCLGSCGLLLRERARN